MEEDSDTSEFGDLTHLPALWPALDDWNFTSRRKTQKVLLLNVVVTHQFYLSKVHLLHLSGTVVPVDLQGAMPVLREPGLLDRAIQVLQTETGK